MTDIQVEGAERLQRLATLIKHLGDNELRKAMLRGLRTAAKPLAKTAEETARSRLPRAGGLNQWVASSKFAARTKASGKSASVQVVATKRGHDLVRMNEGIVRHPVYGGPGWSITHIRPHWWEDAIQSDAGEVRDALMGELSKTLDDLAAKTEE